MTLAYLAQRLVENKAYECVSLRSADLLWARWLPPTTSCGQGGWVTPGDPATPSARTEFRWAS